jgi:23S rRNA (cytidine2498-2'-O)-methyltransferase
MATALFFLPQYKNELLLSLGRQPSSLVAENLIWVDADFATCPWSQQLWQNCQKLEFASIGEAAKLLRGLSKGPWVNSSISNFRRAHLIAESLKMAQASPLAFLDPAGKLAVSGFALLSDKTLIYSNAVTPPRSQGDLQFLESSVAPSRAYLKLWELFTCYETAPLKNQVCLDMGSCPGGWTWVLSELGCKVLSVDKAPLAPLLQKRKSITSVKHDAFTLDPVKFCTDHGKIDWFFSDIICEPRRLFELVSRWRQETGIKNYVTTIKFKGTTDSETLKKFTDIAGSRTYHLWHNKHEVTWVLLGPSEE